MIRIRRGRGRSFPGRKREGEQAGRGRQGKGRGGDAAARVTVTAVCPATESTKQASRARLSLPARLVLVVGFTIMLVSCLSGVHGFFLLLQPSVLFSFIT